MTEKRRLGSWKEIAAHLGVQTRTVQRWGKEKGLPVYRAGGGLRARVFAYTDELDAWLHQHPPETTSVVPPSAAAPDSETSRAIARVSPVALSIYAAALVVVIASLLYMGQRMVLAGQMESAGFVGERLIARDAEGREVWSYDLAGLMDRPGRGIWSQRSDLVRLTDLDGDGRREVLAVVHRKEASALSSPSELLCLEGNGRLRWRYVPQEHLRFGGRDYQAPWYIYDIVVSREPGPRTIWLAVNHNRWWPSFVVRIDANGRERRQFVNSGSIHKLETMKYRGRSLLLAGGVNNEPYIGALAVLDTEQGSTVSPQANGSSYRCENCGTGQPLAYFLFSRTELNKQHDMPLNFVDEVLFQSDLSVMVTEVYPAASGIYAFDDPVAGPRSFTLTDGYWALHRRMEAEGVLKHSADQCHDRSQARPVRKWTPLQGWINLSVPAIPMN